MYIISAVDIYITSAVDIYYYQHYTVEDRAAGVDVDALLPPSVPINNLITSLVALSTFLITDIPQNL